MDHPYQFVIVFPDGSVVYTHWFDVENNFSEGMVVIDIVNHKYFDGEWKNISEDHL